MCRHVVRGAFLGEQIGRSDSSAADQRGIPRVRGDSSPATRRDKERLSEEVSSPRGWEGLGE